MDNFSKFDWRQREFKNWENDWKILICGRTEEINKKTADLNSDLGGILGHWNNVSIWTFDGEADHGEVTVCWDHP